MPGLNPKLEFNSIYPEIGGSIESDLVVSVNSDNEKIFNDVTLLLAFENGEITPIKSKEIYQCWFGKTTEYKKICIPYLATNYPYSEDYLTLEFNGFPLQVKTLIIDEKKIYEILNDLIVRDSSEIFDLNNYTHFIQCIVHLQKPYACEVLDKLVDIFCLISEISTLGDYVELFINLTIAIKYNFQDDLKNARELIKRATEALDKSILKHILVLYHNRVNSIKVDRKIIEKEREYIKDKEMTI